MIGYGYIYGGRYVSSGVAFDADAQAFITAASITDPTQQSAVNQLVLDLKSYSLWSKMKAVYPFVGGSASSHKWNLKDPRDLNAAYRITFGGGWTHNSNGITGNGSNTYGETFLNPSVNFTTTNGAFGFNLRVNKSSESKYDMGTGLSGFGIALYPTNRYFMFGGAYTLVGGTSTAGFYITNRATGNTEGYKDGTRILNQTVASTLPNSSLNIGAATNAGAAPSSGNYDFAFMSDTLSGTDITNLGTALTTFKTTLGR